MLCPLGETAKYPVALRSSAFCFPSALYAGRGHGVHAGLRHRGRGPGLPAARDAQLALAAARQGGCFESLRRVWQRLFCLKTGGRSPLCTTLPSGCTLRKDDLARRGGVPHRWRGRAADGMAEDLAAILSRRNGNRVKSNDNVTEAGRSVAGMRAGDQVTNSELVGRDGQWLLETGKVSWEDQAMKNRQFTMIIQRQPEGKHLVWVPGAAWRVFRAAPSYQTAYAGGLPSG